MLSYLLLINAVIGISYLLYHLFLKQEKTFVFNRFFLLGGIILSLIAPALKIENSLISPVVAEIRSTGFIPETIPHAESITGITMDMAEDTGLPIQFWLLTLYLAITIVMLVRFSRNLIRLKGLLIHRGATVNGLQIIYLQKKTAPFSFFNFVFVNQEDFINDKITTSQLTHELAHSQQLHSIDILLIEVIICCFWFNPFAWLYRRAIAENHEFIADQFVTGHGTNIKDYAKSIIHSTNSCNAQNFTSGFSFIQTKNRITMLNRAKSSTSTRTYKLIIVLSLLSASLIFSSCTSNEVALKPFIVVVDAGHGGHDNGSMFETLYEKDIVLKIAKRLKGLSLDNKVKVVLSRDNDSFLKLLERTAFANSQDADLLLSLHVNFANNDKNSGVEVYHQQEGKYMEQSLNYSKTLISEQLVSNYEIGEIKTAPFWVLKKSNVPSVLIEFGFLSNDIDRANLQNPEYLDNLASSIYASLLKINSQATY